MMYYGYYDFPKAAPRPKAKPGKERKKFGETWWGQQWVEILSDFEGDQRMSRGRAYARADMVKNFKIREGSISATVKGSRMYKITISFKKHSSKDWEKIMQKMAETPIVLSSLLNNERPESIHKITGYSFVPKSFDADCTCPNYANPCKHVAAVFYIIADEIDYDPLILFSLNGMSKNKLFKNLGIIENASLKAEKETLIREKIPKKPKGKKEKVHVKKKKAKTQKHNKKARKNG